MLEWRKVFKNAATHSHSHSTLLLVLNRYDVSMGEEWQLQLRHMLNEARLDFPIKNEHDSDEEDLSRIFEVLSPFSKNKKLGNEVSDVDWLDLLSKVPNFVKTHTNKVVVWVLYI